MALKHVLEAVLGDPAICPTTLRRGWAGQRQPPTGMANPESREVLHSLRAASLAPLSIQFLGDWLQARSLLLKFYMLPNVPTP